MSDKREQLIRAATDLGTRVGLSNASIAAIAGEADVPTGNVYYYFKTKEAIADAVIERRRAEYLELREAWTASSDRPADRLRAFVDHTAETSDELTLHGCPIGGLCADLAHLDRALGARAGAIFADTIDWASAQFRALAVPEPDAEARALVARLQGATVLAHALNDVGILRSECDRALTELPR